ncbi:single-stranded-DNA-specific exonuclease RecJ [Reichenbachiella versicolor]|uniref:single-stranded-DNA-specific exonuclease RecJ n=1 Tax=Reichenbachiella versicolor TaxID=1821036 RepID=UPI000D6E6CED|nr:single-stranded-DNA-specific exonuclease RecJ [Reichenbachiella versicolor]
MIKQWVFKPEPPKEDVNALVNSLGVHPILGKLLVQRDIIDFDSAKRFFRPSLDGLHDPFDMKGMDTAIERLNDALFNSERVLIYGDYDVDGTTSVALMYNFLKEFSTNIFTYIPDRYTEGYGVSQKGIQWAIDHDIDLLITLDCGIRACDTIGHATQNSIDVIICDHHLPGDILPDALAILDPKQDDCNYPYDELSGCGIGFKLLQGLCIQNGIEIEKLYQSLDLVALSIASDIVPITGENRTLAYFGMKKLNSDATPGLGAMIEKAGLQRPLSISDVVFGIGPRINAAGRINHAKTALDLLTQPTKEDAYVFAEKLNLENNERKSFDESITLEALGLIKKEGQVNNHSTVLFKKDWHKGVIGIVASRCIEHYFKPTIILTESNGKVTGSARSVDGFDIYRAIDACSEHLEQFGGHKYAAGLTMKKEKLGDFKRAFEASVGELIEEEHKVCKIEVDTEIDFEYIDSRFNNILKQMGPFGPQNMQPVFVAKNVTLKSPPRVLKEKHLKLFVSQFGTDNAFDAIGFGMGHFEKKLGDGFDIAFTLEENHFRGEVSLQLMLKDIKLHKTEAIQD